MIPPAEVSLLTIGQVIFAELGPSDMVWTKPEYSSSRINRAGDIVAGKREDATEDDWEESMVAIGNWRACHAYPLLAAKNDTDDEGEKN